MYLQLDTRFNPFTYDEMVKPLLYYKQAYDEAEAAYSDLAAQTEEWRNVANGDQSSQAFKTFQRYSGDLTKAIDDFSHGMTSKNNKRALLGLKRRFASDIKPIVTASKRRSDLADEQRRAELANPTMLWERKASDMSLDDFINNPSADYGRSTSGAALSAQVATAAGNLAKEFRDNPKKMIGLVGNDYYEYVKKRGFSSKAILAAIRDNQDASPILTQLVESTIDSAGLKEWADQSTLKQAYNYAKQGLWNAIGQDEAQLVQNWRAQENLSHSHAMARQAADQAFRAAEAAKSRSFSAAEAEKDRQFKSRQMALREIVGKDGKATGTYYDPKLGVITNKDGKIIGDSNGNILGSSKGNTSDTPGTGKSKYVPGTDVTYEKMRRAMYNSSQSKMKELGYSPMYAVTYTSYGGKGYSGNRGWNIGRNGDDHPGITGWAFNTNSNLITKWGNFTTNPLNSAERNWVEDITKLPREVLQEISKLDLEDKNFQIQRVKRDGVNEGVEYDYLIYVKND